MYRLYLPVRIAQTLQEPFHTPKVKRCNIIAQPLVPLIVGPVEQIPYCLGIRPERSFALYLATGGGLFLCLLRAFPYYFS